VLYSSNDDLFFSQSPVFAVAEPPEIKAPSAILMEVQRDRYSIKRIQN